MPPFTVDVINEGSVRISATPAVTTRLAAHLMADGMSTREEVGVVVVNGPWQRVFASLAEFTTPAPASQSAAGTRSPEGLEDYWLIVPRARVDVGPGDVIRVHQLTPTRVQKDSITGPMEFGDCGARMDGPNVIYRRPQIVKGSDGWMVQYTEKNHGICKDNDGVTITRVEVISPDGNVLP